MNMRNLMITLAIFSGVAHAQVETVADAEPAAEPAAVVEPEATLSVDHAPVDSAPVDAPLPITIDVEGAGQLVNLTLVVVDAAGQTETFAFERLNPTAYRAVIPARLTGSTHVAYAIQSTDRAGTVRAHFADAEHPHHVDLFGRGDAAHQRAQLARYHGKRNAVRLSTEGASFGGRRTETADGLVVTDDYSDAWLDVNAEYIYRPLTLIHDLRFRAGFMRAQVPEVDGKRLVGGKAPGLNYGGAEVNLELHRWFSVGGRLILGANEEGFVIGGGAVARIGDIAATHLAADIEGIGDVGYRADIRFHWTTVPRFPMALGVTFTDWPDGAIDGASTLLSYDLGIDFTDRSRLGLRFGAANRPESLATGFVGGLNFQQSF